jgi:hypothetical protein
VDLPDREMVEICLDAYQHSFACHVFPVVDPIRFRSTVATAYSQSYGKSTRPSTYQEYSAHACVAAFLAFVSFFNFGDNVNPIANADEYALNGHRIVTACCLDISIETLQVATMLVCGTPLLLYFAVESMRKLTGIFE